MINVLKILPNNKKLIVFVTGLVLFLSSIPIYHAEAFWWNDLISTVLDVGATVASLPVLAAVSPLIIIAILGPIIAGIIFTLNLILLRLAVNGDIVHLNFTSGGIVDQGLAATTTLVNLGFILVLVIIALATILRQENYGLKKLLPKFLFIVIIINFIPVICGAIIDISNIITKAFLNFDIPATFGSIFNPIAGDVGNIMQAVNGDTDWAKAILTEIRSIIGLSGIIQRVLTGFSMIGFGLFASFVFFLYFILFLLRYIAIWILVIMAPIAWFCSILPNTQKFYKMWWGYFIQWAFVGAIAGFFLKLGAIAASALNSGIGVSNPNICSDCWYSGIVTPFFSTINSMFLNATVSIFLVIGFMLSLKLSGGGTEMILKWGQKLPGAIAKTRIGQRALGGLASKTGSALKGASGRMQEIEKKMGNLPGGKLLKPLTMAGTKPAAWMTRELDKSVGPALINYAAGARKTPLPKNWKQMTIDDKVASIEATRRDDDKFVQIHSMGEEGTLQIAPQLWGLAENLQEKFKDDSYFLKERGDLADILTNTISADVKTNLEVGEPSRNEMKTKIENKAAEFSSNSEMTPIINDEATRIAAEKLKKDASLITATEMAPFKDSAAQNVAARYIHYTTGLKSGDMKNQTKASIKSAIAGVALRDMTPQHIQAIQDNHKTEVLNTALDNAFGKMFEGKTDEESKKIIDDYLAPKDSSGNLNKQLASAHKKMAQWATGNVTGRLFNLPFREHMTDINDQPTNNPGAFGRRMDVLQIIEEQKPADRTALKGVFDLSKKLKITEAKTRQVIKENPELGRWNEWERSQSTLKDLGKKRIELWNKMLKEAKDAHNDEALKLSKQVKDMDKKRREIGEGMRELKNQFKATPELEALHNEMKKYEEEINLGQEEFERFKKTVIDPSTALKSSWDRIEKLQNVKTREIDLFL